MEASGAETPVQFEKHLSKAHRSLRLSSGLWPRYLRGDVIPQGSQANSRTSLITRLDRVYPGTAQSYRHPVWTLLDFDQLLGPAQLRDLYMTMDPSVWTDLFSVDIEVSEKVRPPFWKQYLSTEALQRHWGQVPALDGLAVCLIEARMGYLAQLEEHCFNALLGAATRVLRLSKTTGYRHEKQQSALLVLERMCLSHLNTLLSPYMHDLDPFLTFCRAAEHALVAWRSRYDVHQASLSKPARTRLAAWVREVDGRRIAW